MQSYPQSLSEILGVDLVAHSCYGKSHFTKSYSSVFGYVKFFHYAFLLNDYL
jgi:hypothetical protein